MELNFKRFLDEVGLQFVAFDAARGIQFRSDPSESDLRARKAFGRRRYYWSDEGCVPHLLRIVCRARALSLANRNRNDVEGLGQVDLEASSSKAWRDFRASLSREHANVLDIFRCGAVSTATRRSHMFPQQDPMRCALCGEAVFPSMRHMVTQCRHFHEFRCQVQRTYKIPSGWWQTLPRVTSKSGWITYSAHSSQERRAVLQIAVCRVAIVVMQDPQMRSGLRSLPSRGSTSTKGCTSTPSASTSA